VTQAAAESGRRTSLRVLRVMPPLSPHPCPYLPGRLARDRGFAVERMDPGGWEGLLDAGCRRAGHLVYEPVCPTCRLCIAMRVPVARFHPSRSQRRVIRRNSDLDVRVEPVRTDDEHAALYARYIRTRHDGLMTGSRQEFERFLGSSPVDTVQIACRHAGRLVAVGIVDRAPAAWSCVYCYFDPDEAKRSLGTFNVLRTIASCREAAPGDADARVYLGYWVPGSPVMDYKARFRPCEVRDPDGIWRDLDESAWATHAAAPGTQRG